MDHAPIRRLAHSLAPLARTLRYQRVDTQEATDRITDLVAETLEDMRWEVHREVRIRVPGERRRGRLDLLAHAPNGRSLAIEIDTVNKAWSARKLAYLAEQFWTDALWIRWRGRVTWDVPESVCLLDMTSPLVRLRHAEAVAGTKTGAPMERCAGEESWQRA